MGFIAAFWRGQLGFVWTVILLIGVSAALVRGAGFLGVPAIFMLGAVSIWQCVGAVRFGERILRDGALTRVYGVYAAMGVAVLSNIFMGISILLPPPPEDLVVKGYASKVAVIGDAAYVSGEIDYQILTELEAAKDLRIVVLNSTGGHVQAGRAIGLFLAETGLNTRVDEVCFSACTLVFAGGVKRAVGPNGALGFHGYRFVDALQVQTVIITDIEQKDRAFLQAQGIDAAFVEQIFATSPETLWRPTKVELQAAGVLR